MEVPPEELPPYNTPNEAQCAAMIHDSSRILYISIFYDLSNFPETDSVTSCIHFVCKSYTILFLLGRKRAIFSLFIKANS